MSKKVSYIITDHNITVNYQGQTHIIPRVDSLADRLIQAIRENKMDEIPNLVSIAKRVENFGQGHFTVKDGRIFINNQVAPEVLCRKIIRFSNEGLPYEPLIRFAENLLKNPSYRAVNELFQFLEKNDHPITETGCFIAYKKVRKDFTDVHTGTFNNHPGQILEMPRNQVDESANSHCSNGFHVGNWRYCHEFYSNTGVMLEVEVNPADVVSVPNDLNEKIRVCKYKVLGTIENEFDNNTLLITNLNCNEDYELCDNCGDFECVDYKCEEEKCPSCNGNHKDCDGEDEYPWEDEITNC